MSKEMSTMKLLIVCIALITIEVDAGTPRPSVDLDELFRTLDLDSDPFTDISFHSIGQARFVEVPQYGKSYYFKSGLSNYSDYQQTCESLGNHSTVLILREDGEDNYLATHIARGDFWIGARDMTGSHRNYTWPDGSAVDFTPNWYVNDPDCTSACCAVYYDVGDRTWNDGSCNSFVAGVICQRILNATNVGLDKGLVLDQKVDVLNNSLIDTGFLFTKLKFKSDENAKFAEDKNRELESKYKHPISTDGLAKESRNLQEALRNLNVNTNSVRSSLHHDVGDTLVTRFEELITRMSERSENATSEIRDNINSTKQFLSQNLTRLMSELKTIQTGFLYNSELGHYESDHNLSVISYQMAFIRTHVEKQLENAKRGGVSHDQLKDFSELIENRLAKAKVFVFLSFAMIFGTLGLTAGFLYYRKTSLNHF